MRTISATLAAAAALLIGGGIAHGADMRERPVTAADTPRPYVGFGLGRSRFEDAPCVAPFACDRRDTAWKVFAGTMFSRYFGAELTYLDFGDVNRNGGEIEARGLNLGLVGVLPVAQQVSLLGKVGTIYSRTRTSAATALVATGKEDGFGLSYGVGARFDVTRNWSVRADWDRYRAQFPGRDDYISVYSAALAFQF